MIKHTFFELYIKLNTSCAIRNPYAYPGSFHTLSNKIVSIRRTKEGNGFGFFPIQYIYGESAAQDINTWYYFHHYNYICLKQTNKQISYAVKLGAGASKNMNKTQRRRT